MADINDFSPLSDYVTLKEAAKIMGVHESRAYRYMESGRLKAERAGRNYVILRKDAENFERRPTGRTRQRPAEWNEYKSGSEVLVTDIRVHIREGQEVEVSRRLREMGRSGQHKFTGTMARYILEDEQDTGTLSIWLIWRDTEIPKEAQQQEDLDAFKADFADVLDWSTAKYSKKIAVVHT